MDREELVSLVSQEIAQRREEGCDVLQIQKRFSSKEEWTVAELDRIYAELEILLTSEGFPYVEPSDLTEIRRQRSPGQRGMRLNLAARELQDKLYGAWLGRCAGCLLGKPVEGWDRDTIRSYLEAANAYPLKSYVPLMDPLPERYQLHPGYPEATLGNIAYMARDDDLDFTILALHIWQTYGLDFTTENIATEWMSRFPYLLIYTAERAAYRNLVNGLIPPYTAVYRNPYREWIGAQIRADMWGYVAPGLPNMAAELAFRDASLSHVKNGIYGEMFVAAMLAAALVTDDLGEIIRIGLSEIPQRSRLAEAVENILTWSDLSSEWLEVSDKIRAQYGGYHWIHTINNACNVVMALLWGEGDLEKTITVAVMAGWDTDCNGATCGSIVGAILGAEALPEKWIKPLNDRIESYVIGYNDVRISDLAKRTFDIVQEHHEHLFERRGDLGS